MLTINPKEVTVQKMHSLLLGAVAPRPIAFASTEDKEGNVNLSPFSFFNVVGSNPPHLIFSPARRVTDNSVKHTLENVKEVPEVVINIVNFSIVEQMSLASSEFDKNVNEFLKAGLTEVRSVMVRPPRVAEAPVCFECAVKQVIELGQDGGAGNLVVCEVILAHFHEDIFDEKGHIDPCKLDAVARMGGNWYCRANGEALFELPRPLKNACLGVDQIPHHIRYSKVLTGNDLGRLGSVHELPTKEDVKAFSDEIGFQKIAEDMKDEEKLEEHIHLLAQSYLTKGQIENAWKILLQRKQ